MISYFGTISVGEKSNEYKVLFDSGSQDIFLFDESCKD